MLPLRSIVLPTAPPRRRESVFFQGGPVTYNFDPDRWYDNELAALEFALKEGTLKAAEFEKQKERLMDRYDDMVARLDGTYRIPVS